MTSKKTHAYLCVTGGIGYRRTKGTLTLTLSQGERGLSGLWR